MTIKNLAKAASVAGAAMMFMVANASANAITYSTNGANSGFYNYPPSFATPGPLDSDSISTVSGAATATLTYNQDINEQVGVPSFIDFGNLVLSCSGCTNQSGGVGVNFESFNIDVEIIDASNGNAAGNFLGSSAGGQVYANTSNIVISWTTGPLALGPGTNNATTGNFGTTIFLINPTTDVVAPNSGQTNPGETTIQGSITSTSTPEPATSLLFGGGLLIAGLLGRKKLRRA